MFVSPFTDDDVDQYPLVILATVINKKQMQDEYLDPFGLDPKDTVGISLYVPDGKKKASVSEMKDYAQQHLAAVFELCKAQYVICSDADYFKVLTGEVKADVNLGYVLPCVYGDCHVIYVPSYRAVFYDPPKIKPKIAQSIQAMIDHASGTYFPPGNDIIKFAEYPSTVQSIGEWLNKLLAMDCDLTCDIEAFSLKHYDAGIGSISFAWNQHEGIAFAVDYKEIEPTEKLYGAHVKNNAVRALLIAFFLKFKRKIIFHNISYDATVLVYQLFMESILDTEGLLKGIEVILRDWDCTKLISYLATNSCAGNKLSLKEQSQEFAGNYALEEIKDIRKIPLPKLLEYNLVDSLSTWFTHNKHYQTMVDDEQLEIYETLFKPATVDIVQMQLTGLPVNINRVGEVKAILQAAEGESLLVLKGSTIARQFTYQLNEEWVEWKNSVLKKKRVTLADAKEEFNPKSGPQLQRLLFKQLGLPILSLTDSKQPSTDGETLNSLRSHTDDKDIIEFLDALITFKGVDKILSSFIPAFEAAVQGPDGWHYLCGNFNLGGTVSGRLSSSGPNLQNVPANVFMVVSELLIKMLGDSIKPYLVKGKLGLGKLIKSCVASPPGWLFCGLDFASLEDRISGLTTKDPNKLKVYTDGYDGHCLRAFSYFGEDMIDIETASENAVCYKANVGGTDVYFHSEETVEYLGQTMKGKQLYALLASTGVCREL